jgi:hypothetical protein
MKKLLLFFLIITGVSCTNSNIPRELLQPKELSVLVEEVSIVEAHYQSTYGVPGQYKAALDKAVMLILNKHQCSLSKFKKSVFYYAAHPELQKLLNENIMTRLSRKI